MINSDEMNFWDEATELFDEIPKILRKKLKTCENL